MHDALSDVVVALQKLVASEQSLDIETMHIAKNMCDALWARAVEEYDRSEDWISDGFVTSGAALRDKCRIEPADASVTLKLGRKLRRLPVLAQAFGSGELSRQHAAVLANAYHHETRGGVGPDRRAA